ncbi:MAG: RND family transporter [Dehalococcoidia bacterium]
MNLNKSIAIFLADRPYSILSIVALVTLLLIFPLFLLAPDEQASSNPPGEVYELQKEIDQKFPTPLHFASFVMEARQGDVLSKSVLLDLKVNRSRLIELDLKGNLAVTEEGNRRGTLKKQSYLANYYDFDLGIRIDGIISVLDSVEVFLASENLILESATEEQVKLAFHHIMSNPQFVNVKDLISTKAYSTKRIVLGQEIDYWIAPVMVFHALADNSKLGGAGLEIGMGGGPDVINKEHLNRSIGSVMEGSGNNYEIWGIAIDANLESEDEGKKAGVFIMFTAIAAVLVVGISLNSYWATAITGVGLAVLMVWLKGVSALLGLKSGLVIDLVVPIGMISLGVDFVVHAVRRYREELLQGNDPKVSFTLGYASVLGALLLAMASDSIAFLSNLSSNIEAVIHFGCAAAIAVISSFVILGVVAPLLTMKIDQLMSQAEFNFKANKWTIYRIVGSVLVASVSGASIIMMVAVSKFIGLLLLAFCIVFLILVPILILSKNASKQSSEKTGNLEIKALNQDRFAHIVSKIVTLAATNVLLVIFVTVIVTSYSIYSALKLTPSFDVKDFFDSESDFVIGLDKFDEFIAGGEPGVTYIKGDLTDPTVYEDMTIYIDSLREIDFVEQTPSGEVTFGLNALNLLTTLMGNSFAVSVVESGSGISITDINSDGIPDTRDQIRTIFEFSLVNGVWGDDQNMILRPDQVQGAIYYSAGEESLTTIQFQMPGTRDQAVVTAALKELTPLVLELEKHSSLSRVALTGSPFQREVQLSESTRTLYTSLPIAMVAATLLLLVTMRSLRYAVVTVVPIGLVVAWLYGVMYIFGFSLNFVTAMIGAISIGVGIDYSIHMTVRFREEINRNESKIAAIQKAARGTGVALVASAASSVVGFAIMGFAPMPMFASYGQLTSLMIGFALISSLVVLPALLVMVTPNSAVGSGRK